MFVAMGPGLTALTRILNGAHSLEVARINLSTACLLVTYGAIAGPPRSAAVEAVITIDLPLLFIISGMTYFNPRNMLRTSTARIRSNNSIGLSMTEKGGPPPAGLC